MDMLTQHFIKSLKARIDGQKDYSTFLEGLDQIEVGLAKYSSGLSRDTPATPFDSLVFTSAALKSLNQTLSFPVFDHENGWISKIFPLQLSNRVLKSNLLALKQAGREKVGNARLSVNDCVRHTLNSVRSMQSLNAGFIGKIVEETIWYKEVYIANTVTQLLKLRNDLSFYVDTEVPVTSDKLDKARKAYSELHKVVELFYDNTSCRCLYSDKQNAMLKFVMNYGRNQQSLNSALASKELGYNTLFVTNSLEDCTTIIDEMLKIYKYVVEEIDALVYSLKVDEYGNSLKIDFGNAFGVMYKNTFVRNSLIYYSYLISLHARLTISDGEKLSESNNGIRAVYLKFNSLKKEFEKETKRANTLAARFERLGKNRAKSKQVAKSPTRILEDLEDLNKITTDKVDAVEKILASKLSEDKKREEILKIVTAYRRQMRKLYVEGVFEI